MFYDFYYYDAPPDGDVWNTDNGLCWRETSGLKLRLV